MVVNLADLSPALCQDQPAIGLLDSHLEVLAAAAAAAADNTVPIDNSMPLLL